MSRKRRIADWTGGSVQAEGLGDGAALSGEDHRQSFARLRRAAALDAATRAIRNPQLLERLYAKYNHRACVPPDPLQFVYRYTERRDIEIAAFLASALAYGRVRQIERSLTQLLDRLDNAPFRFASHFDGAARAKLRSFKHRFTTGDDVSDLLGLHNDKTISLSTALKVTRAFAQMNPGDPVKYDFALSRIGILEDCTGRPCPACESCELRRLCAKRTGSLVSAG